MRKYELAFHAQHNYDGSFQYSSHISTGGRTMAKIFEGEGSLLEAMSCLEHTEGGIGRVLTLLKSNSAFHVPPHVPISDEQAVVFGWITNAPHSAPLI